MNALPVMHGKDRLHPFLPSVCSQASPPSRALVSGVVSPALSAENWSCHGTFLSKDRTPSISSSWDTSQVFGMLMALFLASQHFPGINLFWR